MNKPGIYHRHQSQTAASKRRKNTKCSAGKMFVILFIFLCSKVKRKGLFSLAKESESESKIGSVELYDLMKTAF